MKDVWLVDYTKFTGGLIRVRRGKGEFLMWPGDQLTMVPVSNPKKFSWLYLLWVKFAPEIWRRRKRRKSYAEFLKKADRRGESTNLDWVISNEKVRVLGLPPIEFNDFDPRRRTTKERRESLRLQLRQAFKETTRSGYGTPQA